MPPVTLALEVARELERAQGLYAPMHSGHEGYAVILEEMYELWEEIRLRNPRKDKMRAEAIQVAAMAMRFIVDVCGEAE
jgi:hypothetical protein